MAETSGLMKGKRGLVMGVANNRWPPTANIINILLFGQNVQLEAPMMPVMLMVMVMLMFDPQTE